jgi:hypothetical protein
MLTCMVSALLLIQGWIDLLLVGVVQHCVWYDLCS